MKISISTTMTNPEDRQDPWKEALACYEDFADEVVIVGEDWPEKFSWDYIGQQFHKGFEKSTGDWVLRMDLDYFIHENDFDYLHNLLIDNSDEPAIAFPRHQYFTYDRYQLISYVCIAVNKKKFPNIKLNGGGDLCLPTLNGVLIEPKKMPISKAPIWNYEMMFKTKEIIFNDRIRYARAWFDYFGEWGVFGGDTKEEAYDAWYEMIKNRYKKHVKKSKLEDHPKYIIEKLEGLDKSQFGYDCFGYKNLVKFDKKEIIKNKFYNLNKM